MGYACAAGADDIHELLADRQRRHALAYLHDKPEDVATREELASHVSSRHPESPSEEYVVAELHHVSLPKLEDAGLLEYDPRSGAVRFYGHPEIGHFLDETDIRE